MKFWKTIFTITGAAAVGIGAAAVILKPKSVYDDQPEAKNPFEGKRVRFVKADSDPVNADGVRGHLEVQASFKDDSVHHQTFYERVFKPWFDRILSFFALLILSPVLLSVSIAVFLDDPGPIFFTQKRLGKNKQFFKLHKFRSMKMSTPHDVPTHMLENPESYITRVGRFLRKTSMDELPQLWDIFVGNMSIVGPRPALWNQDVLTALRDEYGANDVVPGLTGLAQISGRDELELEEKARLDGEYCKNVSIMMDIKCIIFTVINVLIQKGILEGGTGAGAKRE